MNLIYRGFISKYQAPVKECYRQPHAINWRYQIPGEKTPSPKLRQEVYQAPKALNWRWQY
ncbi:MAG: hypothetical protein N5P05_002136 [Chroococcopsis gigantea SAG 12.99]|jgi:hypothetical protein|nr:hypothetical protein [Chlorogloea purpurea SAG 13.99]MDV3000530.1 hypothetical protein [Chroococcopsis gigantea SAG 12.99]